MALDVMVEGRLVQNRMLTNIHGKIKNGCFIYFLFLLFALLFPSFARIVSRTLLRLNIYG